TDPELERTAGLASLTRWVRVSTVVYCAADFLLIRCGADTVLFADVLTLADQDALLGGSAKSVRLIQAHFPRNWRWRAEFLERFKPEQLVETNLVSDFRPIFPPWPDVPVAVPQKLGWYRWSASTAEKRDPDKTGGKTPGMRPPSDAADLSARRVQRQ